MLRACRFVDAVIENFGDEDSKPLIEAVRPTRLAIGSDWLDEELGSAAEDRYFAQLGVTHGWMDARGLRVSYVRRTRGVSTTAIRQAELVLVGEAGPEIFVPTRSGEVVR